MRNVSLVYLASYALSLLGNSIAAVALPLIVLQATGSVLAMGILSAATAIPAFLAGLVMGVVIDRVNRRTSSVATDLISASAVAALPIVDGVTGLNLGWFILFGVVGAVGDVPGLTARDALLPAIARDSGMSLERLIGIRESLAAFVVVVGPAAAGSLLALFDGPTVLWVTASTSLAAAMLTLLIPKRIGLISSVSDPGLPASSSSWGQLKDGWRVLFGGNRLLFAVTMLNLVMVTVVATLQGIVLPAHFVLIDQSGMFGFVLTAIAAGTLIGSGVYAVFHTRGSRRGWFVVGMLGTVVGIGIISLRASVQLILTGAFVLGIMSGLLGGVLGVLMIEYIPEDMRGRIMGTQNSLMMIAAPAGILTAALVIHLTSLATTGIAVAVVWGLAALVALVSPSLRNLGTGQNLAGVSAGDGDKVLTHEE